MATSKIEVKIRLKKFRYPLVVIGAIIEAFGAWIVRRQFKVEI